MPGPVSVDSLSVSCFTPLPFNCVSPGTVTTLLETEEEAGEEEEEWREGLIKIALQRSSRSSTAAERRCSVFASTAETKTDTRTTRRSSAQSTRTPRPRGDAEGTAGDRVLSDGKWASGLSGSAAVEPGLSARAGRGEVMFRFRYKSSEKMGTRQDEEADSYRRRE
ncbi:hypothetical protein JOB18_048926 [Solea senegalensis]|uniref:Uncharacterized protein n=1 Tax=Solea senegalensis TaxID=28829 RepID=A0AAV6T268_SOLSE|nr:hypothetical protein JOB18_048926 [Solea senegalensis]